MKAVSRDGRKPQKFKLRASAVSNAMWPVEARRRIASSNSAQRRRCIVMRAFWRSKKVSKASARCLVVARIFYVLCILVATSFVLEGLLLVLLMARPWALLLLLTATWMVSLTVANQLLHLEMPARAPSRKNAGIKLVKALEPHHRLGPATVLPFPDTPMPATPLVRVLDTIDLSSSEVEHFLDHALREKERVSQSHMPDHYAQTRDDD